MRFINSDFRPRTPKCETFMADEVFHAGNGAPANFSDGYAKVSFNGVVSNTRYAVGSQTLGSLVQQLATQKGIKAFSVYADGQKLTTADSNKPAASFKEIDIVAKDSRGSN